MAQGHARSSLPSLPVCAIKDKGKVVVHIVIHLKGVNLGQFRESEFPKNLLAQHNRE